MVRRIPFILFLLFTGNQLFGQFTQTVRGKVVDNETNYQLIGATIQIITSDITQQYEAATDTLGDFSIPNVPIGKTRVNC